MPKRFSGLQVFLDGKTHGELSGRSGSTPEDSQLPVQKGLQGLAHSTALQVAPGVHGAKQVYASCTLFPNLKWAFHVFFRWRKPQHHKWWPTDETGAAGLPAAGAEKDAGIAAGPSVACQLSIIASSEEFPPISTAH